MPPEFWIWAAWRDKGAIGWLPGPVAAYYRTRGWTKAPATWWARYWIHKGISVIPKPTRDVSNAKYVVFAAWDPQEGLRFPSKYAIALSADMAYRYDDLHQTIAALRFKGHRVPGWCDCRADGTPASQGMSFVAAFGLDYFIGQAESADQFESAVFVGARVVVGNISELGPAQIKRCETDVLLIQEDYWNEGWARAPKQPAIAFYCIGTYPTALWAPTVATYKAAGRLEDGDGVYHAQACPDPENLP